MISIILPERHENSAMSNATLASATTNVVNGNITIRLAR
jgi:hypothetical protein